VTTAGGVCVPALAFAGRTRPPRVRPPWRSFPAVAEPHFALDDRQYWFLSCGQFSSAGLRRNTLESFENRQFHRAFESLARR
jgi:hypothetical protein